MPPTSIKTHMPSVAQLMVSLTGLVTSLTSIIAVLCVSALTPFTQSPFLNVEQALEGLIFCMIVYLGLSIPSLLLSIRRLARLPMRVTNSRHLFVVSSITLFAVITAFILVNLWLPGVKDTPGKAIFTVLCTLAPLWWFVELGRYRLMQDSPQRFWGLINFGVFAGMPIILVVEIGMLLVTTILGGFWLFKQPEFTSIWMTVQTQLMLDPTQINDSLVQQVTPLIQKPGVLMTSFFLISLAIPLVEEILKPLALWFFMKKGWSPTEGFSAGLICGASFALVESLNAVIQVPSDQWVAGLVARMGTGLLHILTTGVTGWALASSWRDGKYIRLGLAYLFSVCLHGFWNFFALFSEIGSDLTILQSLPNSLPSDVAVWVLGSLSVAMLTTLGLMNVRLRKLTLPPPIPPLLVEGIE